MSHPDDRKMLIDNSHMTEMEWVVSGRNGDLIPIGKFIIKSSSEIKISGFVSCCGTHKKASLSKIEIGIVFWKETMVDDVASFVFETVVIGIIRIICKADQAVELAVIHFFRNDILRISME